MNQQFVPFIVFLHFRDLGNVSKKNFKCRIIKYMDCIVCFLFLHLREQLKHYRKSYFFFTTVIGGDIPVDDLKMCHEVIFFVYIPSISLGSLTVVFFWTSFHTMDSTFHFSPQSPMRRQNSKDVTWKADTAQSSEWNHAVWPKFVHSRSVFLCDLAEKCTHQRFSLVFVNPRLNGVIQARMA